MERSPLPPDKRKTMSEYSANLQLQREEIKHIKAAPNRAQLAKIRAKREADRARLMGKPAPLKGTARLIRLIFG
jgi:hypothetical protein